MTALKNNNNCISNVSPTKHIKKISTFFFAALTFSTFFFSSYYYKDLNIKIIISDSYYTCSFPFYIS